MLLYWQTAVITHPYALYIHCIYIYTSNLLFTTTAHTHNNHNFYINTEYTFLLSLLLLLLLFSLILLIILIITFFFIPTTTIIMIAVVVTILKLLLLLLSVLLHNYYYYIYIINIRIYFLSWSLFTNSIQLGCKCNAIQTNASICACIRLYACTNSI